MPVREVKEESDSTHINDPFSQGSMIERIGSYKPPMRPGFSVNRQELKLQDRVARTLYNKRAKLARHMAYSTSTSIKEIVYSSLIANDISPHSVVHYEDYIDLLIQRQGGLKRWRAQVNDELDQIKGAKKDIFKAFLPVFVLLVVSAITGHITQHYIPDTVISTFIPATLTIAGISYGVIKSRRIAVEKREIITQLSGSKKKKVDDFVSHRKL